jgi:hypothetical protein
MLTECPFNGQTLTESVAIWSPPAFGDLESTSGPQTWEASMLPLYEARSNHLLA